MALCCCFISLFTETKPKKPMMTSHMDKELNSSPFSAFSASFPLLPLSSHAYSKTTPTPSHAPATNSKPSRDPMQVPVLTLCHDLLPDISLPDGLTLGQLLAILQSRGLPLGSPFLEMRLNLGMQEFGALSKTDSSKSQEAKEGKYLVVFLHFFYWGLVLNLNVEISVKFYYLFTFSLTF